MQTQTYEKRKPHYNKHEIDTPILLNSHFLLLPREFYSYLTTPYSDYKNAFLATKLSEIFDSKQQINWFREFYLTPSKTNNAHQNYETFMSRAQDFASIRLDNEDVGFKCISYNTNNILIREIGDHVKLEDLANLAKNCPHYLDFQVYLSYNKRYFQRTGIISVSDDADIYSCMEFLNTINNHSFYFEPLAFNSIFFCKSDIQPINNDIHFLLALVNIFFRRYNINTPVPDGDVDFYILLLRCVFNYCYYCVRQFGSSIEMAACCGDYHIRTGLNTNRSIFDRKNKVITEDVDFEHLKTVYGTGELYLEQRATGEFLCGICHKEFESKEYFVHHFQNKHSEKMDVGSWNRFIDNLDWFLLGIVLGTNSWNVPWFVKDLDINYSHVNETVYDMDQVFSGELKFEESKKV